MTVDIARLLRDLLERDPQHDKVEWEDTCGVCGGRWPCTGERVRLAVAEIDRDLA